MLRAVARLLYTKPLCKLTEREYRAFASCNMGTRGSMRAKIEHLTSRDNRTAKAILCWNDENKLIGCALVFYNETQERWLIYTYVRPDYRRQGVGTAIVAHARRGRRVPLHACPWDYRSSCFYEPMIKHGKVQNAYAA